MCDWKSRLEKRYSESESDNITRSTPHANYCFNAVDGLKIMEVTEFCINAPALAQLRLVSKSFANCIQNGTPMTDNLVFHICGKHPNYRSKTGDVLPSPIRILTDSTVPWAHVKFSYLDLEADLVGHEEPFLKFIEERCRGNLKSLTLHSVYCAMGRMIEILSCCTSLVELKIVNCSSIFETGFEIVYWDEFITPFRKCLSKIRHFTIIDGRRHASVIDVETLQVWMSNMERLVSLDLRSSCGQFPIGFLMRVVAKNVSTLRHFSLVGSCTLNDNAMTTMGRLHLRSLLLGRVVTTLEFENGFLQTQEESLESLHFYKMIIQATWLDRIGNMDNLKKLHFEDVSVVGSGGSGCGNNHPFTKLVTLTDLRLQNSVSSCMPWTSLFRQMPPFYLTTLVLRFNDTHILINLFPQPFLNYLKVLVVVGMGRPQEIPANNIAASNLLRKATSMTRLEKLEITDDGLSEVNFPLPGFPMYIDLAAFKHLKMLNFSRTHITDTVLLRNITKLINLEALYVDETQVTYYGLCRLAGVRIHGNGTCLPKLRMISAIKCIHIRVNPGLVALLANKLPSVQLYVDMLREQPIPSH